jgi:hypothetical protein
MGRADPEGVWPDRLEAGAESEHPRTDSLRVWSRLASGSECTWPDSEQAALGEAHDGVAGHYEMVQNPHVY